MKTDTTRVALALAVGLAVVGVAHGGPARRPSPPSANPAQNMGAVGQGLYLSVPDPKHLSQPLWKAWVKSGGENFGTGAFTGQDITALLFNAGKLDARLTAPVGRGNTQTDNVVASGGARYTSLVPAQRGSYMTAQTVTWNAKTKHGVARGNVHMHDGKSGLDGYSHVLYFNSGLRLANTKPLGKGQ